VNAAGGAGFRILSGTVTSPTLASQLRKLLALYPQAKWHQWEPAVSDGAREGAKLAFGRVVNTIYVPGKADVIFVAGRGFPGERGLGTFRTRSSSRGGRKLEGASEAMNRLYVVEPTPTVTGSAADHKLPMRGV